MEPRSRSRRLRHALVAILLGYTGIALAEHPMLTEDPGTQGTGRFELELGFAATQGDPAQGGTSTEFAPQLAYGVTATVDFIIRGTWLRQSPALGPAVRGIGDTALDVKWRFHEAGPMAYAVRAGFDLPTGNDAKGLGAGTTGYHVVGVVSREFEVVTAFANIGYSRVRQPGQRHNLAVSLAVIGPEGAPLRTFIDVAAAANADPADGRWPAVARTGLLYTVNPSLVLDVGYQARLNASAPRQVLLAGLTLRW